MSVSDHDILIGISKDVKYLARTLKTNCAQVEVLKKENQGLKDWQQNWDVRYKFMTMILIVAGSIISWIGQLFLPLFFGSK
jgi:hypothetical protein